MFRNVIETIHIGRTIRILYVAYNFRERLILIFVIIS